MARLSAYEHVDDPLTPGKKLCFIVGEIGSTQSDEREAAGWLTNAIVEPVIRENFPDFEVHHIHMVLEIDHLGKQALDRVAQGELVVGSLSAADPFILYLIGMRFATGLPLVLVASANNRPTFIPPQARYIPFQPNGGVEEPRARLKEEIERALTEQSTPGSEIPMAPAKASKVELAQRVETVADAIGNLRINSASDYVQQLHDIAQEIRDLPDEAPGLHDLAARALRILTHVFDALGTAQGAQVIIAGAAASILTAGGWPAAAIFAFTLAAWHGKDAFTAALGKLTKFPE